MLFILSEYHFDSQASKACADYASIILGIIGMPKHRA